MQPFEMRLCETERVGLHPNRPYIFTVDPACARCVELAKMNDPLAATVTPFQNRAFQEDVNAGVVDCDPETLPGFLTWLADRLVHVYDENPNVDFVLACRRYALTAKSDVSVK